MSQFAFPHTLSHCSILFYNAMLEDIDGLQASDTSTPILIRTSALELQLLFADVLIRIAYGTVNPDFLKAVFMSAYYPGTAEDYKPEFDVHITLDRARANVYWDAFLLEKEIEAHDAPLGKKDAQLLEGLRDHRKANIDLFELACKFLTGSMSTSDQIKQALVSKGVVIEHD